MKWNNIMKSTKPCKKLIGFCGGTSSGRNNAGRITIFHRGGGSKRLQRKIDLKRSTSSMGIVERIEYDPNRSSKIALVRWVEGVQQISQRRDNFGAAPSHDVITKPITDKIAGQFTLAGLTPPRLMAGNLVIDKSSKNITGDNSGEKLSSVKDVFVSAFSSSAGRAEAKSLNIPRVAVAGAKPEFFSPKMREATGGPGEGKSYCLADVRKWKKDSILWEHRLKRKAAVSWQSFVRDEDLELDRNAGSDLRRQKKQLGSLALSARQKGRGLMDGNRVPLTYILASHELKPGQIVMNCDWSKSSTRKKLA